MIDRLKENKGLVTFAMVLFVAWWMVNFSSTVMHEEAHREICLKHNGTTNVSYNLYTTGRRMECSTTEGSELHMINDIVNYNVSSVVSTLFAVLGLYVVYDQ